MNGYSLALSDKGTPKESLTQKMLDLVEAVELEANVHAASGKLTLKPGERATSHLDLLRLVNNVAKDLATTVEKEYYVLVDDLDLHWTGSELQNAFIGALFSSIAKLGRSRNIKFVVALRQNIFSTIGIEDRDKLRDIVVRVEWGEQALMDMVSRWLAFVLTSAEREVWNGMFPDNAFKKLYGATSGKPREIIRLAAICVRTARAAGQKKVRNEDIATASEEFSNERLEDLSSEYRYSYPGLDHVCRKFAGKKKQFPVEQLEEVAFELAAEVESNQTAVYAWSRQFIDDAVGFARMLLQCGFLQLKAHKADHAHVPTDVEIANLKRENWFAVHPMYAIGLSAR